MQTIMSTDTKTDATTVTKPHFCHKCFNGYIKKDRYDDHMLYCSGPTVEAHIFQKESHYHFDKHASVDAPPFMIFFYVETRLEHETAKLSTMYLVS